MAFSFTIGRRMVFEIIHWTNDNFRSDLPVVSAIIALMGEVGADRTINVASAPDDLASYAANKGYFDVHFEASGNASAVRSGIEGLKAPLGSGATRPRG